jgi:hypothetical protein
MQFTMQQCEEQRADRRAYGLGNKEHNLKGQEQRSGNRHYGNFVTHAELTRSIMLSLLIFSKRTADIMLTS